MPPKRSVAAAASAATSSGRVTSTWTASALAAGRLDRGDRLARRGIVEVADHDRRAVRGEPFRDGTADAPPGSGHDRHATIETPIGHGHPPHPVLPALTWLTRPPNASEVSVP